MRSAGVAVVFAMLVLRTAARLPPPTPPTSSEPSTIPTIFSSRAPPTTTSFCPLPPCAVGLGCIPVPSPNGCYTCGCPAYNCNSLQCGEGQTCLWREVTCPPGVTPCFPQPFCDPPSTSTSEPSTIPTIFSSRAPPTTTSFCPTPPCAVGLGCISVPTPDGCYRCECPDFNYWNTDTTTDTTTYTTTTMTSTTNTFCDNRDITCSPACRIYVGSDGCLACDCSAICQSMPCLPSETCVMTTNLCPWCYTCVIETTTPSIPDTTTNHCFYGISCRSDCVRREDSEGCPYCDCLPTCQTTDCKSGYECVMRVLPCLVAPCPSSPTCVPINPCSGTSNRSRCGGRAKNRWTYNSFTGTCEKFRYYGCTPSPNTFLSPKACRNRCKGVAPISCPQVDCEINCYRFTAKNKCPRCICPNPCEGIKCREGYECSVREKKCHAEPEPYCTPTKKKICPLAVTICPQPCIPLGMHNRNGCPFCQCNAPSTTPNTA